MRLSFLNRSLLPAVSNTTANMVVTGARFVKKKRVIHLEIEQAPATDEGKNYHAIEFSSKNCTLAL